MEVESSLRQHVIVRTGLIQFTKPAKNDGLLAHICPKS